MMIFIGTLINKETYTKKIQHIYDSKSCMGGMAYKSFTIKV